MAESKHNHPHPFKHTHAHDANSMGHIVEHHPHKLSVAHPAHPANEHFKKATEAVLHNGKVGKMEVKGV